MSLISLSSQKPLQKVKGYLRGVKIWLSSFGGGGQGLKNGWGACFQGQFWSPQGWSQMGGGGGDSHQGRSQMMGNLEKLSAEAKSPYNKFGANFGVISVK